MKKTRNPQRAFKRLFIASSQEAQELAKEISGFLDDDLLSVPWWDSFTLGQYTFDDLIHQSRAVDGAIIIATRDDKVWYRQRDGERPRDNVIFEFGLFASRLGLKRTVILAERGVVLPTDIAGVTYLSLNKEDLKQTAKNVSLHFKKEFESDKTGPSAPLRVVCHPPLSAIQISQDLPRDWLMRAMYLGTDGARAWLSTTTDSAYETAAERARFSELVVKMLKPSKSVFRTYVSLGPGDAQVDSAVALALRKKEPSAQCIPVDLSDGLLWHAIRVLSEHIKVPVGILADFEESFNFISRVVRQYGKGPYLYGLFGGTFGSLDGPTIHFVNHLNAYMEDDDELMMDVSVVKENENSDTTRWGDGTKRFFAYGAARLLGISWQKAVEDFDNLITLKLTEDSEPIAGTRVMTVFANGRAFARARRYNLENLSAYFESKGFVAKSRLVPFEGPYNLGLLSLRKAG